jgi:hypothetical protein
MGGPRFRTLQRRAKELKNLARDSGPVAIRGACNDRRFTMNASIPNIQAVSRAQAGMPIPPQQMLRGWMQMLRAQGNASAEAAQASDLSDLRSRMRVCDDEPRRRVGS